MEQAQHDLRSDYGYVNGAYHNAPRCSRCFYWPNSPPAGRRSQSAGFPTRGLFFSTATRVIMWGLVMSSRFPQRSVRAALARYGRRHLSVTQTNHWLAALAMTFTLRRPEAFVELNEDDFDVLDGEHRIGRIYFRGRNEWCWCLSASEARYKGRAPSKLLALKIMTDTYRALSLGTHRNHGAKSSITIDPAPNDQLPDWLVARYSND